MYSITFPNLPFVQDQIRVCTSFYGRCIVDGPTASLTAAGGNWKLLINVGLIMGVIAGACGNYVGIFVAYAVKAICGL